MRWWFLMLTGCVPGPPETDVGATTTEADADADADTDADTEAPGPTVRVMTWNVESLGSDGSGENDAVEAVIERISPDVVTFNEIDSYEADWLVTLAAAHGYTAVVDPVDNPFGSIHNAVITRLPVVEQGWLTSAALSGDGGAEDQTRLPVYVVVELEGRRLAVFGQHWKSGWYDSDGFRRVVDGIRLGQAVDAVSADTTIACGDVNEELDEVAALVPATWTSLPSDTPWDYALGSDLEARLSAGIPNDPFLPMFDAGFTVVDALQMDGRDATRDSSGRRLDHCFVRGASAAVGETYDSRDDSAGEGLPKPGPVPARETTYDASDHFPVFVDLTL